MELAIINYCSRHSHNNNKSFLLKPTQYLEHYPSSLCLLHISKDKLLLLVLIFNLVCGILKEQFTLVNFQHIFNGLNALNLPSNRDWKFRSTVLLLALFRKGRPTRKNQNKDSISFHYLILNYIQLKYFRILLFPGSRTFS